MCSNQSHALTVHRRTSILVLRVLFEQVLRVAGYGVFGAQEETLVLPPHLSPLHHTLDLLDSTRHRASIPIRFAPCMY